MKTISGETFDIRLEEENSNVFFSGALRLTGMDDYAPILDMLKERLTNPAAPSMVDLTELDFLNSSGITMFSRFVKAARDRALINLRFLASESTPWQARSLKNLQRLMPSLEIHLS